MNSRYSKSFVVGSSNNQIRGTADNSQKASNQKIEPNRFLVLSIVSFIMIPENSTIVLVR